MTGRVTGPDGEPVPGAILHVWHANSKGFYSHFDPTGEQTPFNNRRRIKLGDEGRYSFHSKMPNGYSVPPQGATDVLMAALGRHGNRPAHVHFSIEAPGYRTLTTQINFGDDPLAESDFAFGTRRDCCPCRTVKAVACMSVSISCCKRQSQPTIKHSRRGHVYASEEIDASIWNF